ncbi:DNA polymerase Y family protein [Azorhizobium caulinodans]|uniref:Y-family DNA polymerase n=2 Tax=Azorhizobium caulinodans TaxID=7 RepID=UPI002FBDD1C7
MDRLRRLGVPSSPCDASAEPPFALVEKERGALRLAAANRAALRLGLTPGLALADARARVPDLLVEEHAPEADRRFLERIAEACDRYTPMVAVNPPHSLILDVTGVPHLFGGEGGLKADAARRMAAAGLTARLACAGTPEAALALARFHRGPPLMDAASEEAALRALPVAALDLPPETETALRRAGLNSVGDIARRPSAPLTARFGAQATWRLARLLGRVDSRITPRRAPPALLFSHPFAEPIGRMEHVMGVLGELAQRAATELEARGLGGRSFEARFYRSDGETRTVRIETGAPVRDPAVVMRLFALRIEALADPLDPGFGFDLVRLAVPQAEPFSQAQGGLDREEQGEDLGALVDRLSMRFGRARFRRLVPRDTHIPERAVAAVPALAAAPESWAAPEPEEPPQRPLYLFRPPLPIEVLAEVPDGPPLRFRWRGGTHDVAAQEGPERIGEEWWRDISRPETPRDYYRVEDKGGRRFWIFRHGIHEGGRAPPLWYLHGLFS